MALQKIQLQCTKCLEDSPGASEEELQMTSGERYALRAVAEEKKNTIAEKPYIAFTRPSDAGPWLRHDDARATTRPQGPTTRVVQGGYLVVYVR